VEFPLLLALALLLALSLVLAMVLSLVLSLVLWPVRPGSVRVAGSKEAADRNPTGAQASVTVVATVAHNRHGRAAQHR